MMRTWPVGTKIYVCGNSNGHTYELGKSYVVAEIDDDGTLRARDPDTGMIGNWLRWADVSVTPRLGWQFCKTVLSPETVAFLESFEGIEAIVLRENVKDRLLQRIPNLYGAILEEATRVETAESVNVATLPDPRSWRRRAGMGEAPVSGLLRGLADAFDDESEAS